MADEKKTGTEIVAGAGFKSEHWNDTEGNPAGGSTFGNGFAISWQNGPLGRGDERREPNGAFVEDVLGAVIDRIEFYQAGKFASNENSSALNHLHDGLVELQARTRRREAAGIEGTHAEDTKEA